MLWIHVKDIVNRKYLDMVRSQYLHTTRMSVFEYRELAAGAPSIRTRVKKHCVAVVVVSRRELHALACFRQPSTLWH
jgi:hypothetical protein